MKTTKMISAVLAVLLAATLFIGAASAVPAAGETVYVYQYGAALADTNYYLYQGGYPTGAMIITDANGTINGEGIIEGLYSDNLSMAGNFFTLKYPAITLNGYMAGTGTSIAGNTIFKSRSIDFLVSGNNSLAYRLSFTTPAGGSTYEFGDVNFDAANASSHLTGVSLTNVTSGTWSAKASFATGDVDGTLVRITPSKYLNSAYITFTVCSDVTDSITVNKDTIIPGDSVLVTLTGAPHSQVEVIINKAGFKLLAGQPGVVSSNVTNGYVTSVWLNLSNMGYRTFHLDCDPASHDTTYTFTAKFSSDKNVIITVKSVKKGVLTMTGVQNSYYIGNDIVLYGTNTESDNVYIFIKGANVDRTYLLTTAVKDDDNWNATFPIDEYLALDPGTFTFYAVSAVDANNAFNPDYTYATVSISLKQPSLSATAESSTVTQGDILNITGTAELPKENNGILYYIFGENYFYTNSASVTGTSYVLNIDTTDFANGQYFVVVQHPMYDRLFNIGPVPAVNGGYDIKMNNSGDYASGSTYIMFNTNDRQSANAAKALCQALDSQNIDDRYVCVSFMVDSTQGNLLSITNGARSSSYTYGDTLTLSGLNTNSDYVYIYMESPQGTREQLSISPITVSDKTWTWTCSSFTYAKTPELGTYTFYAVAGDTTPPNPSTITDHLYDIWTMDVCLTMNQIIDAPNLENITIVGNATGTPQICYYLFETNYFETGYANISSDGSYRIDINKFSHDAGQYTLVLQHPGEDVVFNVYPEYVPERGSYDIKLRDNANDGSPDTLYWTDCRTGKNAADALCMVIDTQNIDDQYLRIPMVVDPTEGSLISITNSYWSHSFTNGDTLTLSGVNTNSSYVHLYFECPNGTRHLLSNSPISVSADKVWTTSFAFPETPDLGTYTIYAVAGGITPPDPSAITDYLNDAWTKDVCLTVDETSLIITSGTSQLITGNATGTTQLIYYIFGTNYFATQTIFIDDDGSYWAYFNTETIAPGQYFAVIQHPGADNVFNVGPVAADIRGSYIKMNANGDYASDGSTVLFNTIERQSANAAEALCQVLDTQNIDDEYVNIRLIVTQQTITMNPVSDIVKGQPLTVSGTTNLKDAVVSVYALSTAFMAVELNSVDSSSFINMTTTVVKGDTDGVYTWEVTFDTTGLNVDTYHIQVFTEDLATYTTIKVLGGSLSAISLNEGWNFISVPKTLNSTENTAGSLFASVETNNTNILGYNTQTGTWVPLKAGDIIQPLNGYWIYSANTTNISLTYPSTPTVPSVKTLYPGWNAVGLSAAEPTSAKTALAGTSWRTLLPWTLANGKYESAIVNGGSEANSPDRLMTLGNGYWLYVDSQSTLTGLTA